SSIRRQLQRLIRASRRGAEIVETDGDTGMGVGGADAVGGVEADPAEVGHEGLGPGVAGLLVHHAVGAQEVAGHEPRRNAAGTRAGDQDVRVVLTDAALQRERLRRRRGAVGRVLVEGHVLVDLHHERVQEAEHVAAGFRAHFAHEGRHRRVEVGQWRRAQEQARRKPLVGALEHAAGVMGLDQALAMDG
ncbi:hypothetical protein NS44R_14560, partial [Mammaliicoccus sciuri]